MLRRPPRSTLFPYTNALPISAIVRSRVEMPICREEIFAPILHVFEVDGLDEAIQVRSEEHTSELQSRQYLVCRLLLEKKKKYTHTKTSTRTRKQNTTRTHRIK